MRRLNILMPLFGGLGGLLGHFAGMLILELDWPRPLLAACYMGCIGLCVMLGCVLAECVTPAVNGYIWRRSYLTDTLKYLAPAALVPMLVLGAALQGLYQWDFTPRVTRDIYMLVDISGSMEWNDPANERLAALERLSQRFGRDERLEIIVFDHEAQVQLPMMDMDRDDAQEMIRQALSSAAPRGGTEFDVVLDFLIGRIEEISGGHQPVVILLSDGESEMRDDTLALYQVQGIAVNTVGLSLEDKDGEIMLEDIASETGGKFVLTANTDGLDLALSEVYRPNVRFLFTDEPGFDVIRVILYLLAGGCLGFFTAFIFDNKPVTVPFAIGGVFSGICAGLLTMLPFGMLLAAVALGAVFPFFSLFAKK